MLLDVARQRFEPCRFIAELGFDRDAPGPPVVGNKAGAIGQEYAFGRHQVFILVMMS
jgi:hypothetical protein